MFDTTQFMMESVVRRLRGGGRRQSAGGLDDTVRSAADLDREQSNPLDGIRSEMAVK